MANCCLYTMKAVAKDEDTLKRLLQIMRQEDSEYYIYRCQDVSLDKSYQEDGLCVYELQGDVAWSANHWIGRDEITTPDHTLENGAHYVTLDLLAERLGFACEIYTEEPGNQFQEWILCDRYGTAMNDTVDWCENWEDEDGNELDEPTYEGGFDDYCQFKSARELWNYKF